MSLATRIAQEFKNVRSHISGITAYHLLQGNLSVSNEVITNGFSTTLYTGNGGTQSINTGIDMSTQWGNDVSETFGGLVWCKSRSNGLDNVLTDTVRGNTKQIYTNQTAIEVTDATRITAFNSTGFSLGNGALTNTNLATYASWNFQTTHRITGVTKHGKAYTEHYNPFTGFTIIKYEGSGIAGHEIPHSLGRKLGFIAVKNLSAIANWVVTNEEDRYLYLNTTDAIASATTVFDIIGDVATTVGISSNVNQSTNQYIMYGWANSYLDETNKLIGNYEVGVYQGTGVTGKKITTRGKPAWIMIKGLSVASDWMMIDNIRLSNSLRANLSAVEAGFSITYVTDGFILGTTDNNSNGASQQYLYMVVYDNDSGSGKSKYPKATDTSNVQINNAIIPLANGVDSNGSKNSIVVANETITGLTYTQGKNYLYKTDTGYGVKSYEPRYLSSELVRRFAGEQPDYYDVESNKWFNTDAGSELVSNGTFSSGVTTGWTPNNAGVTLSVVNGRLNVNQGLIDSGYAYQQISTIVGKRYKIKTTFESNAVNTALISVGKSIGSAEYIQATTDSATAITISREFIAETITTFVNLGSLTGVDNFIAKFDDISVFQVEITPTTEITESRNYLNHIVHADQNGQVTYVEELPKIEYKDVIKANEYQGKNACTGWVNFDGTTTPPTIRDSYNVSAVIRIATGVFDIYFKEEMDNTSYITNITPYPNRIAGTYSNTNTVAKCTVDTRTQAGTNENNVTNNIQIFGGRN